MVAFSGRKELNVTTPQYKKLLEIINWQPYVYDIPVFKLEHTGAFSPDQTRWNGETLQFSCPVKREYNDVMKFAEHETGKCDWIIRDGFPVQRKDGTWTWVLIR